VVAALAGSVATTRGVHRIGRMPARLLDTHPLQAQVAARLDALWACAQPRLQALRPARHMAKPTIRYFQRREEAGRAWLSENVIELNGVLLSRHPAAMLHETLAHELAHLVVHRIDRRARAHGREWQHVMRTWFGVEPERTHALDVSAIPVRRQRRFRYACPCRTHELTTVRHHRAQRGQRYLCVHCGGRLAPAPPASQAPPG
jgi:SprT protein